ncbi:MAG: DAK2 domain-containing protein [Bacilli bacterium]|nr:DAK2 domain-containing protein [Bacilli bacterium]
MSNLISLNGETLEKLLSAGYKNLSLHFKAINDLNVFPVPDGDTGTNMKITYFNGMKAIEGATVPGEIIEKFASGMLFGARGNSGVLTSQYYRGLANFLAAKKDEITVKEFADAMVAGYQQAYKAAVDPVEGTILTVAREGIDGVLINVKEDTDFTSFFGMVYDAMRMSLDNTPNLLPVLKEAGVIDSGGKGLLTIFEGYLKFLQGVEITENDDYEVMENHGTLQKIDYSAFNENSVLDYGYCTEFLLQLLNSKINIQSFQISEFIKWLGDHGNSIVCFQNGTIVKVHIHTKKPYEVIEYAQKFGEFVAFKMENMALQHNEVVAEKEEKKKERRKFAVISIAQGEGLIELFKEMGSDLVLNGGQTMNTSTAEMIDAFEKVNADKIFLLTDESNIILAARQARDLYKESEVRVIETKTIIEGYSALSMMVKEDDNAEEVYEDLVKYSKEVISCFVAKSSRSSIINGEESEKGKYIEGVDGELVGSKTQRDDAVCDLIDRIPNIEEKTLCILFYGQMVSNAEAEDVVNRINEKYPNLEVGVFAGKQEVYDYLIGIN